MAYETLYVNIEDGIGTITLNRPEKLNALSGQLFSELAAAALEMSKDDSARVVIITGGDKVFAAGADIGGMGPSGPVGMAMSDGASRQAYWLLENMPKPVIAAVAGYALGGGCELALVADIRIAADNAQFGLPEIKLGIIPGAGGTQRLPRLIGSGLAKEMIYTGDPISAEEAWRIGLVNKVVPSAELFSEARKLAHRIASRGALALRMAKTAINEGLRMDLEAGLQYEHKCFSLLFATEDQKEGMRAFMEKRKPNFKGR